MQDKKRMNMYLETRGPQSTEKQEKVFRAYAESMKKLEDQKKGGNKK